MSAEIGVYGATKAALNRLTNALGRELYGVGVSVNTVQPRAAVLSEGADAVVGKTLPATSIEPMETIVESIVSLCDCPESRAGQIHVSLDLLEELKVTVMNLDGRQRYIA